MPRHEGWCLLSHPPNELGDLFMTRQAVKGMKVSFQFTFGEHRVNFGVTDAVYPNGFAASQRLGHHVVFVDAASGDKRPPAKRTGPEILRLAHEAA